MKSIDMNAFDTFGGGGTLSTPDEVFWDLSKFRFKHFGFTLAEMMVVMLILSIIMAAMAPVMTTRNKLDQSSPWVWAENGSDAYYGLGDAQVAMIGQQEAQDTDTNSRLVISTGLEKHHILFKTDNTVSGRLELSNHSVKLGEAANGAQAESANSVMIGNQALGYGEDSVAIGTASRANTYSTAVGDSSEASNSSTAYGYGTKATGTSSVSLGYQSEANASNSLAIGFNSDATANDTTAIGSNITVNGAGSIVIGSSNASSTFNNSNVIGIGNEVSPGANSVAIGGSRTASGQFGVAVGNEAQAGENGVAIGAFIRSGKNGIAIGTTGSGSGANGENSIAIGNEPNATALDAIAIGNGVQASGGNSIAIGSVETAHTTTASGVAAVAIGDGAYSTAYATIALGYSTEATTYGATALGADSIASGRSSIALGNKAIAKGENNVAIGINACKGVTGTNVTCLGANSGPASKYSHLSGDSNMVYIGDPNSTVFIPGNLVVRGTVLLNGERGRVVLRPGNAQGDWAVIRRGDYDGGDDNLRGYPTDVGEDKAWYDRYSDRRLKYVGKESTSGLEKIKQLKVFNYTFKKDEKKTPHVGVIAQDLQKVFPDAVTKAKDGFLRIRFEDMFYAMINAIKELDSRITALEKENQELTEILKQVQNDNRKLQDDNKEFEARLKILETKIK